MSRFFVSYVSALVVLSAPTLAGAEVIRLHCELSETRSVNGGSPTPCRNEYCQDGFIIEFDTDVSTIVEISEDGARRRSLPDPRVTEFELSWCAPVWHDQGRVCGQEYTVNSYSDRQSQSRTTVSRLNGQYRERYTHTESRARTVTSWEEWAGTCRPLEAAF